MPHLELGVTSNESCDTSYAAQYLTSYFATGPLLHWAQEPVCAEFQSDPEELLFRAQGIADAQKYPSMAAEVIGASLVQICIVHDLPRLELVTNALVVNDIEPDDVITAREAAECIRQPWKSIDAFATMSLIRERSRVIHYLPTAHPEARLYGHPVHTVQLHEDGPKFKFGMLGTETLVVLDKAAEVEAYAPPAGQQ